MDVSKSDMTRESCCSCVTLGVRKETTLSVKGLGLGREKEQVVERLLRELECRDERRLRREMLM